MAASIPVPRPVAAAGSAPVKAQISAADAVVFAMPMSPVTRQRLPAATRSRAISRPTVSAAVACSRVIAGPSVKSAVPGAILRGSSPGTGSSGAATPTSTTVTSAPAWAANALTTAPPARKLATIWAVTSCGQGLTPWAWTPWSAAKIATQAGSGSGAGQLPARPASRTDTSSSAPSEPRGLVIRSCRSRAAVIAAASGGAMAAITSASWSTGSSPGSPRRPNSSACTAHDTGRRRAHPAVASSGSAAKPVT